MLTDDDITSRLRTCFDAPEQPINIERIRKDAARLGTRHTALTVASIAGPCLAVAAVASIAVRPHSAGTSDNGAPNATVSVPSTSGTASPAGAPARITGAAFADGGPARSVFRVSGVVLRSSNGHRYVVQPLSSGSSFTEEVKAGRYTVAALNFPQCSTTVTALSGKTVQVILRCHAK